MEYSHPDCVTLTTIVFLNGIQAGGSQNPNKGMRERLAYIRRVRPFFGTQSFITPSFYQFTFLSTHSDLTIGFGSVEPLVNLSHCLLCLHPSSSA
jgi:hypothetical protein